jgi:FK506-binding protein 1
MGVIRKLLKEGDKTTIPIAGDTVKIEYTGWLYDETQLDKKGTQ